MAVVYWIHLPEHTDIFSQGYIGVTRQPMGYRFAQHKLEAKYRKKYAKWVITRAIHKYGDRIQIRTLVIGEEDYCYELEYKLRPEKSIGWNMCPGGQRPFRNEDSYGDAWKEKLRQANLGRRHSEETLDLLSEISKSRWEDPDTLLRIKETIRDRRIQHESPPRFWRMNSKNKSRLIEVADEILEKFCEDETATSPEILSSLGLPDCPKNREATVVLIRRFLGGWNPLEDNYWLNEFRGVPLDGFWEFEDVWGPHNFTTWSKAIEIKELTDKGFSMAAIRRELNLPTPPAVRTVVQYIKRGWNPAEDPRWLNYLEN